MAVSAEAVAVQMNADMSRIGRRMVFLLYESWRGSGSGPQLSANAAGMQPENHRSGRACVPAGAAAV